MRITIGRCSSGVISSNTQLPAPELLCTKFAVSEYQKHKRAHFCKIDLEIVGRGKSSCYINLGGRVVALDPFSFYNTLLKKRPYATQLDMELAAEDVATYLVSVFDSSPGPAAISATGHEDDQSAKIPPQLNLRIANAQHVVAIESENTKFNIGQRVGILTQYAIDFMTLIVIAPNIKRRISQRMMLFLSTPNYPTSIPLPPTRFPVATTFYRSHEQKTGAQRPQSPYRRKEETICGKGSRILNAHHAEKDSQPSIGSKVSDTPALSLYRRITSHLLHIAHNNRFHTSKEEQITYVCPTCRTYRTYYKSDLPRHQVSCEKRSFSRAQHHNEVD